MTFDDLQGNAIGALLISGWHLHGTHHNLDANKICLSHWRELHVRTRLLVLSIRAEHLHTISIQTNLAISSLSEPPIFGTVSVYISSLQNCVVYRTVGI